MCFFPLQFDMESVGEEQPCGYATANSHLVIFSFIYLAAPCFLTAF